ncbi:CPBP family intramembrane glutamic endopeptidase [Glaciecola sp. 2405UD65-10]|uniref:CPBP family intramembrane glutamic endopeptidase n=1 Tax=Glaciecola sp. 2405UD65-10 TaxID=3397244 RepID=UPI003B5CDC69
MSDTTLKTLDAMTNAKVIKQSAWRAIGLFLLLTFMITSIFGGMMGYQGATPSILVAGVMWSPGIAALLTCVIIKRPIASLPWGWGDWKWIRFAWCLPILYGLMIYLPVWVFNLGGSTFGNIDTLKYWNKQLLGNDEASVFVAIAFIAIIASVGMVGSAARALGEEIGWRGFFIWELKKVMPFWAVGLFSGTIWAIWHWPAILFTDYNAGQGNFVIQMFIFTMAVLPQGIVYAYFTFKSNSLWPAVFLHASHNLFIQRVFTPLTNKGEQSYFYIDEFGIVMPILGCFMALYFYYRAKKEGLA